MPEIATSLITYSALQPLQESKKRIVLEYILLKIPLKIKQIKHHPFDNLQADTSSLSIYMDALLK